MKHFEEANLNRKDYRSIEVLATIVRVLLTPIFVWYRLYLWVWDGTMFKWDLPKWRSKNWIIEVKSFGTNCSETLSFYSRIFQSS